MTTAAPGPRLDPWHLERIKRRLDALPHWLGNDRRVCLTGLPPIQDIEGQFRLAGLRCLLAALDARRGDAATATTIWLGQGRVPEAPRLLLWPAPGRIALSAPGQMALSAPGIALPLPDPMHALWGLLEHHPPGDGTLHLPDEPDWRGLLPLLRRLPNWLPPGLPMPVRLGRAVLARAQRLIRAHAEVVAPRPAGSVLAALLGRRCMPTPASEVYWRQW